MSDDSVIWICMLGIWLGLPLWSISNSLSFIVNQVIKKTGGHP